MDYGEEKPMLEPLKQARITKRKRLAANEMDRLRQEKDRTNMDLADEMVQDNIGMHDKYTKVRLTQMWANHLKAQKENQGKKLEEIIEQAFLDIVSGRVTDAEVIDAVKKDKDAGTIYRKQEMENAFMKYAGISDDISFARQILSNLEADPNASQERKDAARQHLSNLLQKGAEQDATKAGSGENPTKNTAPARVDPPPFPGGNPGQLPVGMPTPHINMQPHTSKEIEMKREASRPMFAKGDKAMYIPDPENPGQKYEVTVFDAGVNGDTAWYKISDPIHQGNPAGLDANEQELEKWAPTIAQELKGKVMKSIEPKVEEPYGSKLSLRELTERPSLFANTGIEGTPSKTYDEQRYRSPFLAGILNLPSAKKDNTRKEE